MIDRDRNDSPASSEDALGRLLRAAGPRLDVAGSRSARVQHSVRDAWRADVRRRTSRRRMAIGIALFSTAAVVMIAVGVGRPDRVPVPASAATVALLERTEGTVEALTAGPADRTTARTLTTSAPVQAGEWVTTGANARAALRLTTGVSLRLDTDTRARLDSDAVIELVAGAVYIDSGEAAGGLEVRTPLGTARDIGTQFEVRVDEASTRVRVRDGIVEVRQGDRAMSAHRGTELTVMADSAISEAVAPFGPEWDWTARLAPPIETDGQPLAVFLEAVSREHGWRVRYADAPLARYAADSIMHGSVVGLPPREAVAVMLTSSGLEHHFDNGEIVVSGAVDMVQVERR